MMLQGSIIGSSGDGGPSAQPPAPPHETSGAGPLELAGGGGSISEEERGRIEESDRSSGGNRWPRQETLALIKIRSDMDVAFRDSNLKGPLWDDVSRKLAELGYNRSAKKCKEKFENVYKYHKRTKEGRTSKADGKTYRFFDQLEALEANPGAGAGTGAGNNPPPLLTLPPPPPPPSAAAKPAAMLNNTTNTQISLPQVTVPSIIAQFGAGGTHQNNVNPISVAAPAVTMPAMNHMGGFNFSNQNISASTNSNSNSNLNSSSTSSDDGPPKRKRKWKDFFGTLMKEVIEKQEELQTKFIETIEKRERDRMAREEAWRNQEMAKIKREHELLVQERSMAAAKDAAVINFLQKITDQNPNVIPQIPPIPSPPPPSQPPENEPKKAAPQPIPAPVAVSIPVLPPALPPAPAVTNLNNGGGENMLSPSPSRWPKAEINALINLRTTLDMKYQENGPKGPLWEEISSAMKKLGYNRNAKRCKEKWENINKYYKKVKESSKKRPEDSKTCPYFHQLDAIYREKSSSGSHNLGFVIKPETQMGPIMARPEQQWPVPAVVTEQQQRRAPANEDDYDEDDDEDDDDEEDEGGEYEIVPNKQPSMAAAE